VPLLLLDAHVALVVGGAEHPVPGAAGVYRGEGEAAAARIYAESLGRGPNFYQFTRSMEAMKKAVDKDTTLVLPVDAELFRLLQDSRAQFAAP